MTVYYRQVCDEAPCDKVARVLIEESGGSLYEEQTQTGYAEDIQGYCHSCGNKWKAPQCACIEDLLSREESVMEEAEPDLPDEAVPEEDLFPEESVDADAFFPGVPEEADPVEAEVVESEPAEAVPEEVEQVEPEPAAPEPEEREPVEAEPVEAAAVEPEAVLPEEVAESAEPLPEEPADAEALFPSEPVEGEAELPEEAAVASPLAQPPVAEPEPPAPALPEQVSQPPKALRQRKARRIKATDLVNDIIAGVADPQLMSKYYISASQLEALLQRLVHNGLITQRQIDARVSLADTSITRAFVETQRSMQELDYAETQSVDPVEALAAVRKEIVPPPQPAKPKIKAKQFVRDVEARMSDPQLMQKYGLDEKQLNSLFQRLVDLGMLSVQLLYNRTSISNTSITKAFVEVYQSLEELEE